MESNILQENQSRMSILHTIVDVVATKNSIIDIFSEIRKDLKSVIPCDYVTILFNNEESRHFYLIPALNFVNDLPQDELTIPYSETSITESLRTKATLIRDDLNIRGNLTPGDLKFLPQGVSSDISVPIVHRNRVRAIFNLSSYKSKAFNKQHQQIVEEVALLLSLAIDRIDLLNGIEYANVHNNEWKTMYQQLLRYSSHPIAIVDTKHDIINETNRSFQRLTGFSGDELNGMRFSNIHPQSNLSHLLVQSQSPTNGKHITIQNLKLRQKNGQEIKVRARLVKADQRDEAVSLVFYKLPNRHEKRVNKNNNFPENVIDKPTMPLETIYPVAPEMQDTIEKTVLPLLVNIGKYQDAKYVALHIWNEDQRRLRMLTARKLSSSDKDVLTQPWLIGLNQGPFLDVIRKKQAIYFENVLNDINYENWVPVAKKLGYGSLLSIPLNADKYKIGTLSFFYETARQFKNDNIDFLQSYANYIALVIDNYNTHRNYRNRVEQMDSLNAIVKAINSSQDILAIIQTTAIATHKLLQFDTCSITLFDNNDDRYQTYALASQTTVKLFQLNSWTQIQNSTIGWIDPVSNKNVLNEMSDKFQSHLDLILIARDNYLGTISLASLEPNCYREQDRLLFEQIADHLAFAIDQTKPAESGKNIVDQSLLDEISHAVKNSHSLDEALLGIVDIVANAMSTDLCTIRFLDRGTVLPGVISTMSDEKVRILAAKEISEWIPVILESGQPCMISEISESNGKSISKLQYHAYLGVPITRKDQIIGILGVFWHQSRAISRNDVLLVSSIAGYAALIIENARMQKELLYHSNGVKKTNQELENFVYTVSHDLKSPIVSIQGFTSILLNDFQALLNEESLHYIKRIQSNANQMEALVKDLLELSRIGRVVSPFEDVNIGEMVAAIVQELMYQLEKKGIKVIVEENMPSVFCDKKRMHQVIYNLLDNAVKYIGKTNPSPRIEIGFKDETDQYMFYIKDNGIGISPEHHQDIFGLFRGVPPQENEEIQSTGVGLAIVKRIIEHHQGKIWVDSEPGVGSTFYFTISRAAN
ncbi:GAF domain-containing protein [candidate division KSB1 bacterium]|nr:GAF domain-containing protein [candidate division KSB1 bacterium]